MRGTRDWCGSAATWAATGSPEMLQCCLGPSTTGGSTSPPPRQVAAAAVRGDVAYEHLRGRAGYDVWQQAAEHAVRRGTGITARDAVSGAGPTAIDGAEAGDRGHHPRRGVAGPSWPRWPTSHQHTRCTHIGAGTRSSSRCGARHVGRLTGSSPPLPASGLSTSGVTVRRVGPGRPRCMAVPHASMISYMTTQTSVQSEIARQPLLERSR